MTKLNPFCLNLPTYSSNKAINYVITRYRIWKFKKILNKYPYGNIVFKGEVWGLK